MSLILASLTVLGFYYPPEAGEKVSLEITILMALTFFMQVVSDMYSPNVLNCQGNTAFTVQLLICLDQVDTRPWQLTKRKYDTDDRRQRRTESGESDWEGN